MSFRRDWILSNLKGPRPTPANRLRFLHHLTFKYIFVDIRQTTCDMHAMLARSELRAYSHTATRVTNCMQNHSSGRGRAIRGRCVRRSASSCHAHISARSTSTLTGEANSGAAGTCAWRASSIWAHESQCTAGVTWTSTWCMLRSVHSTTCASAHCGHQRASARAQRPLAASCCTGRRGAAAAASGGSARRRRPKRTLTWC